jgi:Fic family protein
MADIWRITNIRQLDYGGYVADNYIMDRYPALVRHKIPFEINLSDTFVRHLMRIAETKPFLDEYLGTPLEVRLLRKAKVRAITYSNQIEGNHLEESEVTAILQGKRVAGLPKDVKEVQNYHSALDYVEELAEDSRHLKLSDMCDIQRLITQEVIEERQCGRIRTIPVSIVNATTGEILEQCPEPHAQKDLLDDLWLWLEDTKSVNSFARAFAFHFIAVSIHPFADGNGRTVRLMQHLLLLKGEQRLARFVPSETAVMRERDRYYSTIRQTRSTGQLSPIIEFLAECFAVSAEEIVEEGRKLLRESAGKTPEARYRKILSLAKKKKEFSMQDVVAWLPEIPRRTLERDLAALVKKRALKAKGEKKARFYIFPR